MLVEFQWDRREVREAIRGGVRDRGSRVRIQTLGDGVELFDTEHTFSAGVWTTYHIVIHVGMDGPVRARVIPRSDEDGVALSDRDNQLLNRIRLNISLQR